MSENLNKIQQHFDPLLGRQIPLLLKIKVIVGNPVGMIGLFFLIFSIPFIIVFIGNSAFSSYKFDKVPPTVEGTVTSIVPTNSSVNGATVYEYHYDYPLPNGVTSSGISYTEGKIMEEGQKVKIEYVYDNPQLSRIQNMRTATFDIWVTFIILPFILVGGGLFGWSLYKGLQAIKLLEFGVIGYGVLIGKEPTNTRINNRTVYKLTFQFTAPDNKTYQAEARSHQPENLQDEAKEKLVYDINNPYNSVLIDSLPKVVKHFFSEME